MKAPRQPVMAISQVTSGSDRTLPATEPLLKMPQARPRSRRGNQLNAVLVKDGMVADSPSPSISRAAKKWLTFRAAPVAMVKMDHQITATVRLMRTPMRSTTQPAGICMKA